MAERPEDLNLPNAVVTRIIKEAIPEGVAVSKEARLAISKAASVFVLYATSCSNNFALKNKRKTIGAQDVLAAMEDMEFEQFIEPLQQCQEAYRMEKSEKRKERIIKVVEPISEEGEPKKKAKDDQDEEDMEKNEEGGANSEENFVITVNQESSENGDSSSPEIVDGD